MEIKKEWPNQLRWLFTLRLKTFTPWYLFTNESEFQFAADAFEKEDPSGKKLLVFARRQDMEDFAGIEVSEKGFGESVIYFHPSFRKTGQNNTIIKYEVSVA
ncbi:hypothetical protein [Pseudobacteriovorax antillogorgiicola]|uniref:Uncharacterized protein n=1 Tax=Pseudobacteriovorax antillogorgiicola TaxID=1513793 RepID=A0A1Y6BQK8_9BACT|nr:hypothetical protein [Pseudobacteriovorax antillogorgiicola]TCS53695.1 hypothetical protein EDD56_1074 [Pseudobacteriovorax antillogorgiicola]SMF23124.1 hypothetical protein SAMN06296036_107268 [Pseudobacteriovorax antillogorgiicola]